MALRCRPVKAEQLADELRSLHKFEIAFAATLSDATRQSDIIATTTSATKPFLRVGDVSPGTFIAAVGADNEHKHEIAVDLIASSVVVVDDLDQCATIGDLHHALDGGAVSRDHVRASLAEVVAGTRKGRRADDETIIFDSTGVAIEDVAAAAIVYERAIASGGGREISFGE